MSGAGMRGALRRADGISVSGPAAGRVGDGHSTLQNSGTLLLGNDGQSRGVLPSIRIDLLMCRPAGGAHGASLRHLLNTTLSPVC